MRLAKLRWQSCSEHTCCRLSAAAARARVKLLRISKAFKRCRRLAASTATVISGVRRAAPVSADAQLVDAETDASNT